MPPEMKRRVRTVVNVTCGMTLLGWGSAGCQQTPPTALSSTQPALRTSTAIATRPTTESMQMERAKELFYQAVAGNDQALPESRRLWDELGGKSSSDPEVIGYSGATELLAAKLAPWPWQKMSMAAEGLRLEDRAVEQAPDDLELRFLRGATEYHLPGFLGRSAMAESDLAFVAGRAGPAVQAGRLDQRAAAADLNFYGRLREAHDDPHAAIAAWQEAVRISPQSPGGMDAKKHLEEHGIRVN